jgi:threonine/homoserine/homoserine lactone efflux protein
VADSSFASVLAFSVVALVLVLTPGVGTASLVSTVIANGRRAGYLTALGMVIGAGIYALGAALGTSALLRLFPQALQWIAVVGGAFIIWLGLRGISGALRRRGAVPQGKPRGQHAFVTTGVIIALGNAPLPLFYIVVVPQYVPRSMSPLAGAFLLSAIHLTLAGTWMTTLVTMLGRLVDVLRRPRVLLTMQLLTGVALILLGIRSMAGVSNPLPPAP